MAQHFLLSKAAKTLSLAQVFRMSDSKAEETFRLVRWADTKGAPVCPHCGGVDAYECRRPNGSLRFRCRACAKDFTLTSGTLFASHKLPLRMYLAAIAIFCNEVKGKSALAISRDLGLAYKSAFVLLHKLREAMAGEIKDRMIGGDGKTAEVDGGYFGGYVKPANLKENRRDRRLAINQNGKRQCVVIIRERDGNSVPAVFKSEATPRPSSRPASPTARSSMPTKPARGTACTRISKLPGSITRKPTASTAPAPIWAESYFSRLRRSEIGHHHHVAGAYLLRYAQESAWREDNRRVSNGEQVHRIAGLALTRKPSVDFSGYWQRHLAKSA